MVEPTGSERMLAAATERLSRMHLHFGSAVFHTGPDCVPDEVVFKDQPADFFFTVEEMEGEQEF